LKNEDFSCAFQSDYEILVRNYQSSIVNIQYSIKERAYA